MDNQRECLGMAALGWDKCALSPDRPLVVGKFLVCSECVECLAETYLGSSTNPPETTEEAIHLEVISQDEVPSQMEASA